MATPAVFLRALLLLASAMKICQGQCEQGYDKYGNSCTYKGNCGRWSSCPYGFYCLDTQWGSRCGYCLTGYQYNGRTSQCEDIDDCQLQPCQNGGSCTDLVNDFRCDCRSGFTGKTCGTDINECDSSPCQHGTCSNTAGGFQCNCRAGYSGTLCNTANSSLTMVCGRNASASIPTDACNHCKSGPCAANTTCLDVRDDFRCLCPEGFINALDNHTCVEKPDLLFDAQTLQQASGLELRAMFATSTSVTRQSQNWTCAVEALDCSRQEMTLQADVGNKDRVSSVIFLQGDVTLGNPGSHFLEARVTTPFRFRVQAVLPVYVKMRAPQTLTVACSRNPPASLPVMPCAHTANKDEQSGSSLQKYAIAGGVAAVVIIAIVVVVIVVFRRKRNAAKEKDREDNPVSFSDLKSRDSQLESGLTGAQAPNRQLLTSRSTSDSRTAGSQAVAMAGKSKGGNRGKPPRVPAPCASVADTATSRPASAVTSSYHPTQSTARDSNFHPYELPTARGPEHDYTMIHHTSGDATGQSAQDSLGHMDPGQTSRPLHAGGDVTYSHLGEADRSKDVDNSYEDLMTHPNRDVINGGYDAADDRDNDSAAGNAYSTINPGQGEAQEGEGSWYERVDPTYTNSQ